MNSFMSVNQIKCIVRAFASALSFWPLCCLAGQTNFHSSYPTANTFRSATLRADVGNEFEIQCQAILGHFADNNLKAIIDDTSKDGVIVVRRNTDRLRNFRPIQESKSNRGIADYLWLEHLRPHAVLELNVKFDPSMLPGEDFRNVVKQFARFVTISKSSPAWRPTLHRSLYLEEYRTYLSYVADGKLVSGVFWHIYFKKEDNRWKITRIEYSGR